MLDYSVLNKFIARYFNDELISGTMLAGHGRWHESGYFDIQRFYGQAAVDPQTVKVHYIKKQFELVDETMAKFSAAVEERLREENRLYDGPPTMKLVNYSFSPDKSEITVQPAHYGDQAGTCFALDKPDSLFEPHSTLRDYYKANYPSNDITANPLALCLGVCGLLVSTASDGRQVLLVNRSGNLASLEKSIGPSAAGSVDYHDHYDYLGQITQESMANEVGEELGLKKDEYKIIPLAFAREIFRGESPQLFCLIETELSVNEIKKRIKTVAPDDREFDSYEFTDLNRLKSVVTESGLPTMNHEALMNFCLAQEFYQ